MSKLGKYVNSARKLVDENSPSILTALGVSGLLSTVVLAVRATPEALRRIDLDDEIRLQDAEFVDGAAYKPQTIGDKVRIGWRPYVPAAIVGGTTVACIIGANSISSRRNAALISLYTLSERALGEYKEKVVEVLGESKAEKVREAIVSDKLEAAGPSEVVIFSTGNVLCFDTLTGRYFESNVEKIRKAENDINRQCINDMYASQNDFYRLLGLPQVAIGEELGWTTDNELIVEFTSKLIDDKPVLALGYRKQPKLGYHKVW